MSNHFIYYLLALYPLIFFFTSIYRSSTIVHVIVCRAFCFSGFQVRNEMRLLRVFIFRSSWENQTNEIHQISSVYSLYAVLFFVTAARGCNFFCAHYLAEFTFYFAKTKFCSFDIKWIKRWKIAKLQCKAML